MGEPFLSSAAGQRKTPLFRGKNGQFSTLSTHFSTPFAENSKKKRGKASFLRENPVENTGERVENPFLWGKPVEFHCVFPFFLRTAAIRQKERFV
ncbi:MAG: hypothetical protein V8R95_00940 [Faecalibacterium sp.]